MAKALNVVDSNFTICHWALPSITRKWRAPEGTVYVTITMKDNMPYWVDLRVGKCGNALNAAAQGIASLTGGWLRTGVEISEVVSYLHGISMVDATSPRIGPSSMADALARTLDSLQMTSE